jgi:hypothetical protein
MPGIAMPVVKEISIFGFAMLALLLLQGAFLGETGFRFDNSLYASATYAPAFEAPVAGAGRRFAQDLTPAARVSEVFGQFSLKGGRDRRGGLIRS